jgi:S1-C subfamily serine protease
MASDTLSTLSSALAEAVARIGPSVVRVEARRRPSSGVAVSSDQIVTAAHTIESDEIEVGLPDGRSADAALVGRDPATDVALLRVEGAGLQPAPWLEPAAGLGLQIGNLVLAVSRPGRTARASLGVVSAVSDAEWRTPTGGRLERYLETDVALRPGFSGSALVDAQGRVVALNTVGLSRGSASAIPASTVRRVVEQLQREGSIPRGYLGVSTLPARLPASLAEQLKQPSALLVASVDPESPAGKAGLLFGDAIAAIDGHALRHPAELLEILDETTVGKAARLRVVRAGELRELPVTIGKREARP